MSDDDMRTVIPVAVGGVVAVLLVVLFALIGGHGLSQSWGLDEWASAATVVAGVSAPIAAVATMALAWIALRDVKEAKRDVKEQGETLSDLSEAVSDIEVKISAATISLDPQPLKGVVLGPPP